MSLELFFSERECIILGDFNTDVAKSKRCNLVKSLCAFKDMFNVFQIIKRTDKNFDKLLFNY